MGCGASSPAAAANTQSARENAKQAANTQTARGNAKQASSAQTARGNAKQSVVANAPAPKVKETKPMKKEEDEEDEEELMKGMGLGVPQIMVREPTAPRQQRPIKKAEDHPLAPGKNPNAGPIKIDPRSGYVIVQAADPPKQEDSETAANSVTAAPIAKPEEPVVSQPEPKETEPVSAPAVQNDEPKNEDFEILNWHAVDINKDHPEYSEFAAAPPPKEAPAAPAHQAPEPVAEAVVEAVVEPVVEPVAVQAAEPVAAPLQAAPAPANEADDDMAILNWENVDISKNYPATGPVVSLKKEVVEEVNISTESQNPSSEIERPSSKPALSSQDNAESSPIEESTSVIIALKDNSDPSVKPEPEKDATPKQSSKQNLTQENGSEPEPEEARKLEAKVISQVGLIEISVKETDQAEMVETPVQKPLYAEPLALDTEDVIVEEASLTLPGPAETHIDVTDQVISVPQQEGQLTELETSHAEAVVEEAPMAAAEVTPEVALIEETPLPVAEDLPGLEAQQAAPEAEEHVPTEVVQETPATLAEP